jgi:amino-acid N-acetyltransferase
MEKIQTPTLTEVQAILKENKLPYEDIIKKQLYSFFGYYKNDKLIGLVGLEIFDTIALLRSLCIKNKSAGVGSILLDYIEKYSLENNIKELYLLTTTADIYFRKKGFKKEDKSNAPNSIKNSNEFKSICPCNAIFMVKKIIR